MMDNLIFHVYIPSGQTNSTIVRFYGDGTYKIEGWSNDYGPWRSEPMKWTWRDDHLWLKLSGFKGEMRAPEEASVAYQRYLADQVVT